jgi:chorismate mutase
MDLTQLRKEIDSVDEQILTLVLTRKALIKQVAEFKKQHELPIYAPEREIEILSWLKEKVDPVDLRSYELLYGMIMDMNKLNEYRTVPKEITIPTRLGGASVRAILPETPGVLCRYLSPLCAANITIADIRSQTMPGDKVLVDIELVGHTDNPDFLAALSVLEDTAESFTLL